VGLINSIDIATAAEAIPTIVAARALGSLKSNTVLARLVNRNWSNEVAQYGSTVKIPMPGALVANDKLAQSQVTLQNPALDSKSVTLDRHKEVSFLIEDVAAALSRPELLDIYMAEGIVRIAEAMDSDIAALFSGLVQSVDATAGLDEEHFRDARRLINAAKAPMANRYAVLHEDAEYEFLGIEKAVKDDYKGSLGGAVADAWTGRFMGFQTFMDQQIAVVEGTDPDPDVCQNLFFHRDAFVLVTRPLPRAPEGLGVVQTVMDEDGIGLRVTMGYSKDYLGLQVTIDVLYGVEVLREDFGVAVRTQGM